MFAYVRFSVNLAILKQIKFFIKVVIIYQQQVSYKHIFVAAVDSVFDICFSEDVVGFFIVLC